MALLYFIALLPMIIGGVLWYKNKSVVWWEWIAGCAIGFALAGIFHGCALWGMTDDTEIWSGQVIKATFYPKWVEEYQEAVYVTKTRSVYNSSTKSYTTETYQEFSHYETRYRTHHEYWTCHDTLKGERKIDKARHKDITAKFGNDVEKKKVHKSGFHSGDPNIYISHKKTDYVYPTTCWKHWENRIKAAPSVFSFIEVPEEIPVFEYPVCKNFFESDRLFGTAKKHFDQRAFDQMCAWVGPKKKCNVIIVGFGSDDSMLGQYQEAKWIGGRKNDLVICYGPNWSYVFGWTEKSMAKIELQNLFIEQDPGTAMLPEIQRIITQHYIIKDWSKFDYIKVDPPGWLFPVFFVALGLVQTGFWFFAHHNDIDKGGRKNRRYRRRRYF